MRELSDELGSDTQDPEPTLPVEKDGAQGQCGTQQRCPQTVELGRTSQGQRKAALSRAGLSRVRHPWNRKDVLQKPRGDPNVDSECADL